MSTTTEQISWKDTFIYMARMIALRSRDPRTKVGACIVDEQNRIIGLGYNGMPRGCDFSWEDKHMYVVHAEHNAILNSNRNNLSGCKLYVTLHPCNECAKHIIQAGIREVYYLPALDASRQRVIMAKDKTLGAQRMFARVGVICQQIIPDRDSLLFTRVNGWYPPIDQSYTYTGAHC